MKITRADAQIVLAVAAAVTGLALWSRAREATADTSPQPRYESPPGYTSYPHWHPGEATGGVQDHVGYQWRTPDTDGTGVACRHRYPSATAPNITALITRGWSALNRPAPQDADWIGNPPSDAMW